MKLNRMRRWGQGTVLAMAAASFAVAVESCTSNDAIKLFRDSASPMIGDGIKTILDGVIDGVVTVVDPSAHSSSSSSSNST